MQVPSIIELAQVRSEYTSARLIFSNLRHRLEGTRFVRHPGYIPPETDVVLSDGSTETLAVRDSDVRCLDRVPQAIALDHIGRIWRARRGDPNAAAGLVQDMREAHRKIANRFAAQDLVDNQHVLPYTTARAFTQEAASHKGAVLLDLSRLGFATADFSILTADAFHLDAADLEGCIRDCVRNLEILSGRRMGDPQDPLLIAVRSALPKYFPGFMPTYLNAGLTPEMVPGLPARYGEEAAARIRLNNRKTLLEALDPEACAGMQTEIHPGLMMEENEAVTRRLESLIVRRDDQIMEDAFAQVLFFVKNAYAHYTHHLDVLSNFMLTGICYPAVILQRMVCSVIDKESYAGVLYSRHPRLGQGVHLQFARQIYGEDLMTGRVIPEDRLFRCRDEARLDFPAVYHFWNRLPQLEDRFRGPVMVEFTGVHGTFTVLQVDAAELSGAGMLTSVMDMHREGRITAQRMLELLRPHHIRQIESDVIDAGSLQDLVPFARGVAVLPQSDVTGKLYFSVRAAEQAREERGAAHAILAKARFTPQDAIDMQKVSGICSLSPAAIHVVTTTQNLGIPALLNLEESGVQIDTAGRRLVDRCGAEIREGEWVTISSRHRTLYAGRAVYAPACLLRFMAGEEAAIEAEERPRFARLAADYAEYRRILEDETAARFASLQDLGHAIRYGILRDKEARAVKLVNDCFDRSAPEIVANLLKGTLGTHLVHRTAFALLTPDRRVPLLRSAAARCRESGTSGYEAGAFLIGSLVDTELSVASWRQFPPEDIAFLLNEWILYQKYLRLLEEVGDSHIRRARAQILGQGLGRLAMDPSKAAELITLKLSRADLRKVRSLVSEMSDPQTGELVDCLLLPFGKLCDYANPASLERLRRLCGREGVPLPAPHDC
jgi:hypothetical protein